MKREAETQGPPRAETRLPFPCTQTQGFPTGVSPRQSSGSRVHFSDLCNFQRISINLPHPQDEWQLEAKCFPAKERNGSFLFFPLHVSLPLPSAGELNVLALEELREPGAGANAVLPGCSWQLGTTFPRLALCRGNSRLR